MTDCGVKVGSATILYNPSPSLLYVEELRKKTTSKLTERGALAVFSNKTGRLPDAKRIVEGVDVWRGAASPNHVLPRSTFEANRLLALDIINRCQQVYVIDGYAGWSEFRLAIRFVCTRAYHALFMRNMLVPLDPDQASFTPDFVVYNADANCDAQLPGNNGTTSIAFDFEQREGVILGTDYAGEMKKGVFTLMHYYTPLHDILSLHSSVNIPRNEEGATIFFGLSGTGKTTLSADPSRLLIGDDEHCWSENGLYNIEGGCYAKCIGLSFESEPDIYNALNFGCVLENVVVNENGVPDYNDSSITENTRASFPITAMNAKIPCVTGHPTNIIMLCCDAFGVLPAVSKLNMEQAIYYFVSGYTAKVAGTEIGITEPQTTFSACFGQPFLAHHPAIYAQLLYKRLLKHNCAIWLVNTGWLGGPYGQAKRCPLSVSRRIIDEIHSGGLVIDGFLERFGLKYAKTVAGVDIDPHWEDLSGYQAQLGQLAAQFIANYRVYSESNSWLANYTRAGPQLSYKRPSVP